MENPALQLEVSGLCKAFGGTTVLRGLELRLAAGAAAALVGPSGSGKSTLLNIVGSLDRPDAGRVCLGGTEVTSLEGEALAEYRRQRVGFVFQEHLLLPQCTAVENVLLPTLAVAEAGRTARHQAAVRAQELLCRVGLDARANAFPDELSGGERQRVAVARALMNEPALLLCDEPTGNLDAANAGQVAALLLELVAEKGVMLLLATHNLELAARTGRVLRLAGGRLLEDGQGAPFAGKGPGNA